MVSMPHMAMKFLTEDWSTIITVKVDPKKAKVCYALNLKKTPYMPPTGQEGTVSNEMVGLSKRGVELVL